MDDRAAFLLSKAALPVVEIPISPSHTPRPFRLPTVVRGGPDRAQVVAAAASGRFQDRTLAWFNVGEGIEETAETEYEDGGLSRARLWGAVAAATAVVMVGVTAILW